MSPMIHTAAEDWKPTELDSLITDVIAAVESGEIDSAFDNARFTAGRLSRTKNTRDFTKNCLIACLKAGVQGISEAKADTALGLVNAFRRMNGQPPLAHLPKDFRVIAVKLPHPQGNPDVEIYIKQGDRVVYGEKILPHGILTENFLSVTGPNPS